MTITRNGVIAKIHRASQVQNGQKYDGFMVNYTLLGKRKRIWRSTLDDAKTAAEDACDKIANGDHQVLELTNGDRQTYLRATDWLKGTGIELDVAARDHAALMKGLPPNVTPTDLLECWRRRNGTALEKRTVRQAVDELYMAKKGANVSKVYLSDLQSRLSRFANDFQMPITDVTGKMIQAWLDGMDDLSGRTKQNYLAFVQTLFRFAIRRKYLPKDALDEVEAVEKPQEDVSEPEIFTPAEMREILSSARPEIVPCLAIGAFAGVRSFEITRLDWSCVNLGERFIEIKPDVAKNRRIKTAARRIVPITDNLAEWLKPHAKENGSVVNFFWWWHLIPAIVNRVNKAREAMAKEEGKDPATVKKFAWKHNGLRHSFCSYRLAAIKNTAQVALEAGNSPQMIFQHYRQVVTESEASKWFSIGPK